MCTLSWLPEPGGYRLWFNRDERRTRTAALSPQRRTHGSLPFVAPLDPEFGGSWIGSNARGATFCLANRYHGAPTMPPANRISRGLLLASLLDAPTCLEVAARVERAELKRFEPFTVAGFEIGSTVLLLQWNGRRLDAAQHPGPGLVLTTSGHDQAEVEAARRRLFDDAVTRAGGWTPALLRELHGSHLPIRGPASICMHRDEAETVSLSEVAVQASRVAFTYWPGSPCQDLEPVQMTLDRVEAVSETP
ncbi:MAG TPA: NRDE family protein [Streptosporangiaceae bacterium]|nr:NRDE family protein [Streptosporangiaceae bacterium]